jgi:hypothetical protein
VDGAAFDADGAEEVDGQAERFAEVRLGHGDAVRSLGGEATAFGSLGG